ncbi:MAG: hypothetical protein K2Y71_12520 [Xanthobacteraceae bacterium]|nr:hypothetical protein [Xanthobacteraceae bacterium]
MAVVILVARIGRRGVSATMSLVSAPQRQTKTRCSIFANFGCCSDRANDVWPPQASQLGFFGVFVRIGDLLANAHPPVSFRWN